MVTFNPQVPLGQAFQAITNLGTALPYGDGQRVPFEFSSTLRELASQIEAGTEATFVNGQSAGAAGLTDSELNQAIETQFGTTVDEAREVIQRYAPNNAFAVVRTLVNPSSISWRQPKRISRQDVRNGTVYFHFTDENGQDNDVLELELRGTTGNVDLRGDQFPLPGTQDTASLRKLAIFQNLYALTREPRLIPPRTVNEFSILYRTKLFPTGITFFGFYSEVLSFEENADNPNAADWTMNFTVQRTEPPLDQVLTATQRILSENTAPQPSADSTLFSGGLGG